mmetsp:Transcript_39223/g.62830  ORF Transcript_39223/g.62830 Transcript_39223/m.62830 type:complete len:288 (+) Transcript_39223:248-1111(+)
MRLKPHSPRQLRPNRFTGGASLPFALINPACVVVQCLAKFSPENILPMRRPFLENLRYFCDAQFLEFRACAIADPRQLSHGERGEVALCVLGVDSIIPVRFRLFSCESCHETIVSTSNACNTAGFLSDVFPQSLCERVDVGVVVALCIQAPPSIDDARRDVKETLVTRYPLHVRRDGKHAFVELQCSVGILSEFIWCCNHAWAQLPRLSKPHSRLDSKSTSFIVGTTDLTGRSIATFLATAPAYDNSFLPQCRIIPHRNCCEETVHIHVENPTLMHRGIWEGRRWRH